MAMSNCRECGREVSTLAKSCPGCGVPNPTKISKSIKTKVKSKRVSKSSLSSKSKNNLIKDFWEGKISLGKSFWLGGFVALAIAGLPLVYATLNIDNIFKLPSSIQWDEDSITWESFGTPPIEKEGQPFQITQDDSQQWIDIDISEFIDWTVPLGQLSLVMQNISKGVGNSCVSFASRETCHSPKLVVTTTS